MSKKDTAKRIEYLSLRVVREKKSILYPQRKIDSPKQAAELFRQIIGDYDRESFYILYLNTKNEPNAIHNVSIGTLSSCLVHPRDVYKLALLNNSAAIICCHNHPSGNPDPSEDDIAITLRLTESGNILGIDVLDHIILGDSKFTSLKESGLM